MTKIRAIEATADFPGLLKKVEAGEEIVITRRGNPVAKIVPMRSKAGPTAAEQLSLWKKHWATMRKKGKTTSPQEIRRWIEQGRL
jgi:prevent-host-death family protein